MRAYFIKSQTQKTGPGMSSKPTGLGTQIILSPGKAAHLSGPPTPQVGYIPGPHNTPCHSRWDISQGKYPRYARQDTEPNVIRGRPSIQDQKARSRQELTKNVSCKQNTKPQGENFPQE